MNFRTDKATLAFAIIMVALFGSLAQALTDCTTVSYGVAGNTIVKLPDDYESVGGLVPCVNVVGAGIDLDGHTITCRTGYTCATAAIQLNDFTGSTTSATAKNGKAAMNGGIYGAFNVGVNSSCVTKTPVVTDLSIAVSGNSVIAGGRIFENFIRGCTLAISYSPDNHTAATNQYVQDNFIDCPDAGADGIYIASTYTGTGLGPRVQNNFVRVPNITIADSGAMTGKVNILNNVFVSALNGTAALTNVSGGGTTLGSNVCDIDLTASNLTTCALTSAPFALP